MGKKLELSQVTWNVPVVELKSGDRIHSTDAVILVARVETDIELSGYDVKGVRVWGTIVKGFGRSKKMHSWTYHEDQVVDLE